jgi:hypothetical protein
MVGFGHPGEVNLYTHATTHFITEKTLLSRAVTEDGMGLFSP